MTTKKGVGMKSMFYKYFRYVTVLVMFKTLLGIGKVYNYIIYGLRHRARYAVYNYLISNDKFFISLDKKYKLHKVSRLKFILYFIFVWMWLDDSGDKDTISSYTLLNVVVKNHKLFYALKDDYKINTKPFTVTTPRKVSPMFKKVSIDTQKYNNFFHYFRYTTNTSLVFKRKVHKYLIGYEQTNKYYKGRMIYRLIFKKLR